jgi:hypothetical protein
MKPFSALTKREKAIELVRWLLVLPAAALGDYAGYFIGGMLLLLAQSFGLVNPASDDSELNRFFRYLIWLFPVGVVVVITGAQTAPRFRLAAATGMAILWILWTDAIHRFQGPTVYVTPLAASCGAVIVLRLEKLKQL